MYMDGDGCATRLNIPRLGCVGFNFTLLLREMFQQKMCQEPLMEDGESHSKEERNLYVFREKEFLFPKKYFFQLEDHTEKSYCCSFWVTSFKIRLRFPTS
ncbi:hypothetical protein CBL_07144 [Carabus blaptoides fortunei]